MLESAWFVKDVSIDNGAFPMLNFSMFDFQRLCILRKMDGSHQGTTIVWWLRTTKTRCATPIFTHFRHPKLTQRCFFFKVFFGWHVDTTSPLDIFLGVTSRPAAKWWVKCHSAKPKILIFPVAFGKQIKPRLLWKDPPSLITVDQLSIVRQFFGAVNAYQRVSCTSLAQKQW